MSSVPISIIFQNPDFIVVNKPAGLSVHNNEDPSNLLKTLAKQLSIPTLFPVHRLDKETSGSQLLAFNERSARDLADTFQKGFVRKIYVGVLRGELKETEGVWSQSLTDKAEGRKNPSGLSRDRVPCETHFKVLKRSRYFTLCEFDLITGRQHQIRKHAALSHHALVGDSRYGDQKYNKKIADLYKTDRMFLHCQRLEIQGQTHDCAIPPDYEILFRQ